MAKVVSLINMKGGVGKSTLTVNLAWHLAGYTNWLKKVLVVDLDPQFNASQYLVGANKYHNFINDGKPTVWDIFEQHKRTPNGKSNIVNPQDVIRNVVTFKGGSKIDLIPSRLELSLSLKNPTQKPELLSKLLKKVENEYDLILIDCAPTESVLTTAAYLSSDYLLVPVKPEYLSTIGLPLLVNSMTDFLSEYEDHTLELLGVVYNATSDYAPEEQHSKNEVAGLAKKHGWKVFETEITFSRSYPKGAREGQPIFKTSYARSSQAGKFKKFADEFGQRVGL
ncbi:ParA family protein [Vibrio cholerae]|uniref:ParA family protein n=1 Tax=Vibrio cholerae TaxID=666 RepID=UPI001157AC47|nr:ParA family protein [Vibrio cholerae]TQP48825.1 ParA family protein [Vibrio cholerae]TQP77019.1 ParA family protein [Vibrio cholerae]TQQ68068.1 ParA family protein [Vibrio cholerae]